MVFCAITDDTVSKTDRVPNNFNMVENKEKIFHTEVTEITEENLCVPCALCVIFSKAGEV
jgi:hypothetical protein